MVSDMKEQKESLLDILDKKADMAETNNMRVQVVKNESDNLALEHRTTQLENQIKENQKTKQDQFKKNSEFESEFIEFHQKLQSMDARMLQIASSTPVPNPTDKQNSERGSSPTNQAQISSEEVFALKQAIKKVDN